MKRTLYIMLLLCCAMQLRAQYVKLDKPEVYLGATAGVTLNRVRFSPTVKQSMLPSVNFGFMWRYVEERHFGLQAELNYSGRGWDERESGYTCHLDYLELPVLAHVYFGNQSRFFFNLGPKGSILLNERRATADEEAEQYRNVDNRLDYSVCGGMGYELHPRRSRQAFLAEVRFNFGLGNLYHSTKSDYFSASDHINFAINLGWMIDVHK